MCQIVLPNLPCEVSRSLLVRANTLRCRSSSIQLTPCKALELKPYNITVNAYSPGLISTPMSMFLNYMLRASTTTHRSQLLPLYQEKGPEVSYRR